VTVIRHTQSMISVLSLLMGSSSVLSVLTLLLLFTGNIWAMAVTAAAALILAALAIPALVQQEDSEQVQVSNLGGAEV
jgi:membrane protein implicated in regulation of membrane protease activity